MSLQTFLLIGELANVEWMPESTGAPNRLLQKGYGPVGEVIYRNKDPYGEHRGRKIWLIHASSLSDLDNMKRPNCRFMVWNRAKGLKKSGQLDRFEDEKTFDVDGNQVTQTTLHVIAGGGAATDLHFGSAKKEGAPKLIELEVKKGKQGVVEETEIFEVD